MKANKQNAKLVRKASFNGSATNIRKVFAMASSADYAEGLAWYANAHCEALRIVSPIPSVAAGMVAAMSPGMKWERNIPAAGRVRDASVDENMRLLAGLGVRWTDGLEKAIRIVRGESPESVLRGNKVRAFYACLANPRNDYAVCVDGHAFAIWSGRRVTLEQTPNLTNKRYETIARAYRKVAKEVGLLPMQVQAITWVVWRRLHLDNGQLRLTFQE